MIPAFRPILRVTAVLAAALLSLLAALAPAAPARPAATAVSCTPANTAVPLDAELTLEIAVSEVSGLAGADVQLAYDPAALVAAAPQLEPLDAFLRPDLVLRNAIDPAAGTIWYAAVQVNRPDDPVAPADGSGALARMTFTAVQTGQFTLPVTSSTLSDVDGRAIPHSAGGCTVHVYDETVGLLNYLPLLRAP